MIAGFELGEVDARANLQCHEGIIWQAQQYMARLRIDILDNGGSGSFRGVEGT
jgi:hypothetical protein